jgi:DNA primase
MEISYRSAISYIAYRFGIEAKDLDPSNLWYWKFGIAIEDRAFVNRVIMPSFSIEGDLNYFTGRTYADVNPKYLNPNVHREDVIFNEININWNEPLTIVEGPFDLIKCNSNATCLLGSDLTTDYKLFLMLAKHKTPVILALDPDAKDKVLKIADMLSEYDISVSIMDIPAPYKDVGELTQSQFNSLLGNVTPFSKDYLLRAKISKLLKA